MRYFWFVWSAVMPKKSAATTPSPLASPSMPSRNCTAFVTVTNQRTVSRTSSQMAPGTPDGTTLRMTW